MVQNILTILDNIAIAPEEVVDLLVDTQSTVIVPEFGLVHLEVLVVGHLEVVVLPDITGRSNIVVV